MKREIACTTYSALLTTSSLIFPSEEDIAFIDEVMSRGRSEELNAAFQNIWKRRITKKDALGIHGILFYGLEYKKVYYPTRRDEEAVNPDGSRLRAIVITRKQRKCRSSP